MNRFSGRMASWSLLVWLTCTAISTAAESMPVEGFTEPYRTINVAAADTGIIERLNVREGEVIQQGQVLASLDCALLYRSLDIADEQMKATGRLRSAQAQLELSRDRLANFESVLASGHARQEEVERARAEVAMAEGNLLAVQEDLRVKALDYQRIKTQIQRRTICSPIDGVVRRIVKYQGEFAAPNDPTVMTVVQLDLLLATFSVPSEHARGLRLQQQIPVRLDGERKPVEGIIEVIDPVTDAESGGVLLKLRLDNRDGRFRGGEQCTLRLPKAAADRQAGRENPSRIKNHNVANARN